MRVAALESRLSIPFRCTIDFAGNFATAASFDSLADCVLKDPWACSWRFWRYLQER